MVDLVTCLVFVSISYLAASHENPKDRQIEKVEIVLEDLGYSSFCVKQSLQQCEKHIDVSENVESLNKSVMVLTEAVESLVKTIDTKPNNCADVLERGNTKSGVYTIYPFPCCSSTGVKVFCEQGIDSGGWTVIQRRMITPEREDFFRPWTDYLLGFGKRDGEYWLGLKNIYALTNFKLMELRVDLLDWEKESRYAKYSSFRLKDEKQNYALVLGNFKGNVTDDLSKHNQASFSTKDNDNDVNTNSNCAAAYKGGFWYTSCHNVNINGLSHQGKHESYADGINWHGWKGHYYSLKETRMMIRPVVT